MKIRIDTKELEQKAMGLSGTSAILKAVTPDFKQATTDFLSHVQDEAPRKNGQLIRATDASFPGVLKADVGTDLSLAPYAKYVITGTRPHDIYAKNFKALGFYIGNSFLMRTKVRHPGTKANPYIVNSWAKHKDEFINMIEKSYANAIEEA